MRTTIKNWERKIHSWEEVVKFMNYKTSDFVNESQIIEDVNDISIAVFLDKYGNVVDEAESSYALLKTSFVTSKGETLYLYFIRNYNDGEWFGARVNDYDSIIEEIIKESYSDIISEEETVSLGDCIKLPTIVEEPKPEDSPKQEEDVKEEILSIIIETAGLSPVEECSECETVCNSQASNTLSADMKIVLDMLSDRELFSLNKESYDNRLDGNSRLGFYLCGVGDRLSHLIAKGDSRYYVANNSKTAFMVNIGLVDKFGRYIICVYNLKHNKIRFSRATRGKDTLLADGFSKEQVRVQLPPIKFYDDKTDLIADDDISLYDIDSVGGVTHIFRDRFERISSFVGGMSMEFIVEQIDDSVRSAVKKQALDYKYIIPCYNAARNKVNYLIPIYFARERVGKPDVVALFKKSPEGLYGMVTVLSVSDAYDLARCIAPQSTPWISSYAEDAVKGV